MSKKRRTRSQKIIAQLRRKLKNQQVSNFIESQPRIEPKEKNETKISLNYQNLKLKNAKGKEKNELKINLYSYDPQLIKKDLFKTFYLSLLIFSLIGLSYWYFVLR